MTSPNAGPSGLGCLTRGSELTPVGEPRNLVILQLLDHPLGVMGLEYASAPLLLFCYGSLFMFLVVEDGFFLVGSSLLFLFLFLFLCGVGSRLLDLFVYF